ncbi:MAG: peptide chain release factor 2 [Clostridia bacterium]|jgi:peptide chain release factor 2|nr:peptide chain release factor 2 [Clostridia bacterium]
MLILDDIKAKYRQLKEKFDVCAQAVDLTALKARRAEVEEQQQSPDLYSDLKRAQAVNSEAKYLDNKITLVEGLSGKLNDLSEFMELAEAESDESLVGEIEGSLSALDGEIEQFHLQTLLKGEYDRNSAILTLHAGAGGTEAQDWVSMLYRMYRMYCEKQGFSLEEIDYLAGDEAGIKSVTFAVRGINAYGYLKAEKGVHRLVRISPFDANARRHTSFASLEVMPEIEGETEIKINPEDLRVDRYRSGGAGGQHVNKTDSAIRITHIPTGIVVQCQNERSQIQNRETAMRLLMGKLIEMKERENADKANEIKGEMKKIEWGSQIRSYVFQPYTLVKDHRTGVENPDVQAVMNGDIEEFIFDYLRKSG